MTQGEEKKLTSKVPVPSGTAAMEPPMPTNGDGAERDAIDNWRRLDAMGPRVLAFIEPGAQCGESNAWVCNRPPNHPGDHVAYDGKRILQRWPRIAPSQPVAGPVVGEEGPAPRLSKSAVEASASPGAAPAAPSPGAPRCQGRHTYRLDVEGEDVVMVIDGEVKARASLRELARRMKETR